MSFLLVLVVVHPSTFRLRVQRLGTIQKRIKHGTIEVEKLYCIGSQQLVLGNEQAILSITVILKDTLQCMTNTDFQFFIEVAHALN